MSIYKRTRNGKLSEYYYFKFEYQGKTVRQCTETANKYEAMAREREARAHAIAGRWADVRRMSMRQAAGPVKLSQIFLVYKNKAAINPQTVRQNISALRTVCASGFPSTEMEELTTHALTAKLVRDYKSSCLTAAGQNKVALETAKITANSTYTQARSVFSKQMLDAYKDADMDIAEQVKEFRKVPMFEVARRQYKRPSIEMLVKLLTAAFVGEGELPALRSSDPNAFKAFLLCLGLGLRKNAAGHARYSWITEQRSANIGQLMAALRSRVQEAPPAAQEPASAPPAPDQAQTPLLAAPAAPAPVVVPEKVLRVLMVQIEEDFQPKGKDETCIPMDDFVHAELQALRVANADTAAPDYILHGHMTERVELVWRRLAAWMTALGWDRRMKAHELRKLYGSEVASAFGIYAAQKLLGHKDANLTSTRYADITNLPDVRIFG